MEKLKFLGGFITVVILANVPSNVLLVRISVIAFIFLFDSKMYLTIF